MAASDYVPTFFKKPLALGGASTDEYAPFNTDRTILGSGGGGFFGESGFW